MLDAQAPPGGGGVATQGLVDDVPRVATFAKVRDEVGDVVDEHRAEGLVGPGEAVAMMLVVMAEVGEHSTAAGRILSGS